MLGIYFSGTGNTKHCVERFVLSVDNNAKSYSIEDGTLIPEFASHDIIVFGFPVYCDSIPKIVKDFISENAKYFRNKKIFIITTKALFNGAGVIHAKKMLEACDAEFLGSVQFNMPDNIRDLLIMELVFSKNYDRVIAKTDRKIDKAVTKFRANKTIKSGLSIFNYIFDFVLKILWFYPKTDKYISAPKIDNIKCNRCGICVNNCPMNNIKRIDDKIVSGDKCTICYRCFNSCPKQALTILGHKVYAQYNCPNSKR
ncbi:MAG: EFR1 family ferrodoxin [Clostridiales bacterium]|nr:EFR1 family ferrodoxin [Clostridiales bacterium]